MENIPEQNTSLPRGKKKIPWISLSGLILGGLGGFLYYWFVGCKTGSCAITSNPWLSVAWGGAFGYLFVDLIVRSVKRPK